LRTDYKLIIEDFLETSSKNLNLKALKV
jgi:hypothetical protein